MGAFEELEEALSACQIVTVHCAVGRDHHSTVNNTIPDGGKVQATSGWRDGITEPPRHYESTPKAPLSTPTKYKLN